MPGTTDTVDVASFRIRSVIQRRDDKLRAMVAHRAARSASLTIAESYDVIM